jgi:hypothetical protein
MGAAIAGQTTIEDSESERRHLAIDVKRSKAVAKTASLLDPCIW